MGTTSDFYEAEGSNTVGFFTPFVGSFERGAVLHGTTAGVRALSGVGEWPTQQAGWAAGVIGRSNDRTGAAGASLRFPGVYGQTGDSTAIPLFQAGVYGASEAQPGVIGYSRSGDGVQGATLTGTAVSAVSFFGLAANALSGGLSGVTGISGAQGPAVPNLPTIAGVVGSSVGSPGVIGTSTSVGIYAFSNNVGLHAQATDFAPWAGYFAGNVNITETLTANVKNAAVPFPDGSKRLLHCMESPEHWFEDFGAAKLKGGRIVVKLDADFAKAIKHGDYHVFLSPNGDCGGLYVRSQGDASFEVRELGGGKSSGTFSYRIVGRRRDIKAHRRFAKFDARLPVPAKPRPPTEATLRTFLAGLQKQARKRARKGRSARS